MKRIIFVSALVSIVGGCASDPVIIGAPCILPSDLMHEERIAPLPEQEVSLTEGLKMWRNERGEYQKLADRKNDTVRYVREHCK